MSRFYRGREKSERLSISPKEIKNHIRLLLSGFKFMAFHSLVGGLGKKKRGLGTKSQLVGVFFVYENIV